MRGHGLLSLYIIRGEQVRRPWLSAACSRMPCFAKLQPNCVARLENWAEYLSLCFLPASIHCNENNFRLEIFFKIIKQIFWLVEFYVLHN